MRNATSLLTLGLLAGAPVSAQELACPAAAHALVEEGWRLYRSDAVDRAAALFAQGLDRCPDHLGALVGHGYTQLRLGRIDAAADRFTAALASEPDLVDALMGTGLVAWRRGDAAAARSAFQRVLALDSSHLEARALLDTIGVPPERPPLVLPDTIEMRSRTSGDRFQVLVAGRWHPFYIRGVNLGAALPGHFPSQFPDSTVYSGWVEQIGAMGANAIRIYTIHPPAFYKAIERYNRAHPTEPVWLIHGVWTGLPPAHDFGDTAWNAAFVAEMRRVVDVLHGRADVPVRPGHASGYYTADVSGWTLAYIIGREWEPYAVQAYDRAHPGRHDWNGRYLAVSGGSATDVWMAQALEGLIAYETEHYRTQRPVAYTSWPTLDPLHHPTETSVAEDRAMRGIVEAVDELQHDDDVVSLDPSIVTTASAFRAGLFAAYHAYPYYPDFIVLGGGYDTYLRRLKARHPDMPIVIAEYGVPVSLGVAHLSPEGWHHGGHTESEMAAITTELTRLIAARGMAGGILFAWIDEWFKRNWLVAPLEQPEERNRFWLSRMNPEQQYGVLAIEPEPRLVGATLAERAVAWRTVPPLYDGALRALADEAYLRLLVTVTDLPAQDTVLIGLDVIDADAGSFRWPGGVGQALPVGLEFVIVATPHEVRVLADPAANPFRVRRQPTLTGSLERMPIADPPPGVFQGPYDQVYRFPLGGERHLSGRFDSLRVVTNRVRLGRDTVEYAAAGYEWGFLPAGAAPDGFWEADTTTGFLEIRVPWTLINVADPSSRRVLTSPPGGGGGFVTRRVDDIGLLLAVRSRGAPWQSWPASNERDDVARLGWETWNEPRWRARPRPVYQALRDVFRTVGTTARER